jgi:hypothetical protein
MPIFDYHCGPRFDFDCSDPSVMGLEIECYVKREVDIADFTQQCFDIGKISPERDGSLDYGRGVEFVFGPVPFAELAGSHIERWANLACGKVKTWRQQRYGMHISMNVQPWSRLHVSAFKSFIIENQTFFEKMAGREENPYCQYSEENYHSSAVNSNSSRMEVRIFQASASFRRICFNFQLLDSLRNFIANERISRIKLPRFKKFSIENESRYPLLAARFQGSYYEQPVSQV